MSDFVYAPGRDIVASAAEVMKAEIKKGIAESSGDFCIDMTGVEMIDSRGLGLLIAAANSLAAVKRRLHILKATSDIVELMRLMRMDKHMDID